MAVTLLRRAQQGHLIAQQSVKVIVGGPRTPVPRAGYRCNRDPRMRGKPFAEHGAVLTQTQLAGLFAVFGGNQRAVDLCAYTPWIAALQIVAPKKVWRECLRVPVSAALLRPMH